MIRRHSRSAIFMHWFNACCWIFLLFSGFALLVQDMQPVGNWWHDLWAGAFGERGLLVAHLAVGSVWVAVYAVYLLLRGRSEALPFLREVTHFEAKSDALWCLKKGMWLVAGPKLSQKIGVDTTLPPQGFYNAGQRGVAVCAVAASILLALTGIVMGFFSGNELLTLGVLSGNAQVDGVLQWSIYIHFLCAAVMAVFLPIHIYMGALAPGEAPALRSMFTGFVPEEHAAHHNPLWYARLKQEGKTAGN